MEGGSIAPACDWVAHSRRMFILQGVQAVLALSGPRVLSITMIVLKALGVLWEDALCLVEYLETPQSFHSYKHFKSRKQHSICKNLYGGEIENIRLLMLMKNQ